MASNIQNIKNHIKFLFMRMSYVFFLMAVILWQAIEWSQGILFKSQKYLRKIILLLLPVIEKSRANTLSNS